MFISFAVGAVGCIAFTYALGKFVLDDDKKEEEQKAAQKEIQDFTELKSKIRNLNATIDRIEQVETLLTDIEICKPAERHTGFSITWDSDKNYNFLSDGESMTTEKLHALAEAEYQKLRASLLEQIQNLQ